MATGSFTGTTAEGGDCGNADAAGIAVDVANVGPPGSATVAGAAADATRTGDAELGVPDEDAECTAGI